jgi:small subunit ribosomal protein S20
MARNPSAMKYHRQSERTRARNRARKSMIRTFSKKAVVAAEQGDQAAVEKYQKVATSLIDRAQKGSTLHKNNAARRKSRLMKRLNKVRSQEQAQA